MDVRVAKEARLAELKAQLISVEGSPTEVYSRIVGYYRSVRNWNAGKREEFGKRREYAFPSSDACSASFARGVAAGVAAGVAGGDSIAAAERGPARHKTGKPVSYLLFTRRSCPNCPPVRDYMAASGLQAQVVDVDSDQGPDLARAYEVLATPTVVLLDADGEEVGRGYTRAQLMAVVSPVAESVLA